MDIRDVSSSKQVVSVGDPLTISLRILDYAILDSNSFPLLDAQSDPVQSSVVYLPLSLFLIRDANGNPIEDSDSQELWDSRIIYFQSDDGTIYMSAIKEVYAMINGVRKVATYDDETQTYTVEADAPDQSSWSQPDHVYKVTLTAS